jgi:DNA-binding transcriptional ArsR family regulator
LPTGTIRTMLVDKKPMSAEVSLAEPARARKPSAKAKSTAIAALADTLDANFFKAIAEPVRQQIVLILLQEGRSNVQAVAQHLVQDRSVVSRHLAFLEQAGFVRSHRIQRFTEYELDGPAIIGKLEKLLAHLRTAAALCCPPADGSH